MFTSISIICIQNMYLSVSFHLYIIVCIFYITILYIIFILLSVYFIFTLFRSNYIIICKIIKSQEIQDHPKIYYLYEIIPYYKRESSYSSDKFNRNTLVEEKNR